MDDLDVVKSRAGTVEKVTGVFGINRDAFDMWIYRVKSEIKEVDAEDRREVESVIAILEKVLKLDFYDSETVLRALILFRALRDSPMLPPVMLVR